MKTTIRVLIILCIVWNFVIFLENKVMLSKINDTNQQLKLELSKYKKELALIGVLITKNQKVTVTGYHPPSKGINSDKSPETTALMQAPIPGGSVAISRELHQLGWLGKKIYIEGYGVFKANDLMGKSTKGKHIDICMESKKEAMRIGKKANIAAVVVEG